MQPEIEAVLNSMPQARQEVARLVIAAASDSSLPSSYSKDKQEADAVFTVYRIAPGVNTLRMLRLAAGALIDGAAHAEASARSARVLASAPQQHKPVDGKN